MMGAHKPVALNEAAGHRAKTRSPARILQSGIRIGAMHIAECRKAIPGTSTSRARRIPCRLGDRRDALGLVTAGTVDTSMRGWRVDFCLARSTHW